MRIYLIAAIFLAAGFHALVFFGHLLLPSGDAAPTAPAAPPPTIALTAVPPPEAEPPEVDDSAAPPDEAPADAAAPDLAPPMQADVPAPVIQTAFQQTLQPPPPPSLGLATAITIPKAGFTARPTNLKNVFDLSQLDQRPQPTFSPQPNYPYELRRARISGTVTVGFAIDAEGNVLNPHIVRSSNSGFDAEALRTAQRWKFRPGKKAGKAVVTRRVVRDIEFNLPNE